MKTLESGQIFGGLEVIKMLGSIQKDKSRRLYLCKCVCGTFCTKTRRIAQQNNPSCGCLGFASMKSSNTKHGFKGTSTYSSWRSAKYRCTNSSSRNYQRYGGKGIIMCEEWKNSFEQFLKHMGTRPSGTTLDRINPFGNYEPGNCRWATPIEQSRNRIIAAKQIKWKGSSRYIADVAFDLGISPSAALQRLKRGKLYESA